MPQSNPSRSCVCCGSCATGEASFGPVCVRCRKVVQLHSLSDAESVRRVRGTGWRPSARDDAGVSLQRLIQDALFKPMQPAEVADFIGRPKHLVQHALASMTRSGRPRVRRLARGLYERVDRPPLPSANHALVLRHCTGEPRPRSYLAIETLDSTHEHALSVVNALRKSGHLVRIGFGPASRYQTTESGAAAVAAWDAFEAAQ